MRVSCPGLISAVAVWGAALAVGAASAAAQEAVTQGPRPIVLEGADRRPAVSLDGEWHSIVDPYFTGLYSFHHQEKKDGWFQDRALAATDTTSLVEYDFAKSPTLKVPGDWNTQRDSLLLYEGPVWYERRVTVTPKPGTKVFLHVGAANYQSSFWVNGTRVCDHEGGFTTFDCEVTTALKPGMNSLVAAVDSTRHADGLPTLQTDWWNYGGLTRSVSLVEVPTTFIEHYDLHLDRADRTGRAGQPRISGWVEMSAGTPVGTAVRVRIPELKAAAEGRTDAAGRAAVSLAVTGLTAWSPDAPKLYKVELAAGTDMLHEEMGFKTIEVRGTEILLNGKPIFLRGVCIHAEAPYRTGRANTEKDADTLLGWAKEMNANFVRLAHYPHDEKMTRAADRLGLLVWSEIPVYWAVEFEKPEVLAKAKAMLHEEIDRDRNRASIGLWSIANETPNTPARTKFLAALAEEVRAADPNRLVTAALLVHGGPNHTKIIDDPLGTSLDVIGFNEYIGWYEGTPATADATTWQVAYQKPLIVSEFGGGAKAGLHGDAAARWTEEYQAAIFEHQLPMLNKIPNLRGMTPWVLMDFRSPSRQLPGVQDYFNRKGLVSDQGQKKKAFGVLEKAYRDGSVGHAE